MYCFEIILCLELEKTNYDELPISMYHEDLSANNCIYNLSGDIK